MKKCSKALKKRVSAYTETIFNDCVCEVFDLNDPDDHRLGEAIRIVRILNAGMIPDYESEAAIEELKLKRDKVGSLYQDRLCKLSTKQLNEIVKAHQLPDGFRRAPKTIENILSELARRAIFNDSNESDHTDNDGEVDGPKRKSAKYSKKTSSKRRKTRKTR